MIIKINSFAILGSKQMTDQQRVDWLLGPIFEQQLADMKLALRNAKLKDDKKGEEAQELFDDLVALRSAVFSDRRTRDLRNIAIVVTAVVAIGGFLGLSLGTGGGFSLAALTGLIVAHQAPAIAAMVTAIALPLLPNAFKSLAGYFQANAQLSVAKSITKINNKIIEIPEALKNHELADYVLELKKERDSFNVLTKMNSWFSSTRNAEIGNVVGRLALVMDRLGAQPAGKSGADTNFEGLELERNQEKALLLEQRTRLSGKAKFIDFASLQEDFALLTNDAKVIAKLKSAQFAQDLPKMKREALDTGNIKIIELVDKLGSLSKALVARDTAKRRILISAGITALAVAAIALDLSGAAGAATGVVLATLSVFKITPMLIAGSAAGLVGVSAILNFRSNYKKAQRDISRVAAEIKTVTSESESTKDILGKAKRFLNRDSGKLSNTVRTAVDGIVKELLNPTQTIMDMEQRTAYLQDQRMAKLSGLHKIFDESDKQQQAKNTKAMSSVAVAPDPNPEDDFLATLKKKTIAKVKGNSGQADKL
jgi:hypothetical protein